MKHLVLFAAVAVVILEGANVAAAAELPTYELMGLPITPLQISVVGSTHVQEVSPVPTRRHARLSSSDRGPHGA
jgi:hypothetical protein